MPENLLQAGGAGGLGAVLGVLMSFFGFKSKIEDVDKRVDKLTDVVQFSKICSATHIGLTQRLDGIDKTQTDMSKDIKEILQKMPRA